MKFDKLAQQCRLSQCMDASGTPIESVINVPDSGFDLSTKDIPDICKAVPIPASKKMSDMILKFKRYNQKKKQ